MDCLYDSSHEELTEPVFVSRPEGCVTRMLGVAEDAPDHDAGSGEYQAKHEADLQRLHTWTHAPGVQQDVRMECEGSRGAVKGLLTKGNLSDRLRALATTRSCVLSEQLQLLVQFDQASLYRRDGCRSTVQWMDAHMGLSKSMASEQLRVGKALRKLPALDSLFAVGKVSFSKLREITRVVTEETDAEFALATLALSVSETKEYCQRFRHNEDKNEDADIERRQGQDARDAHGALRAYERRSLTFSELDDYTCRIVIELPRELGEEFRRSLEHCEDWIQGRGEDGDEGDAGNPVISGERDKAEGTRGSHSRSERTASGLHRHSTRTPDQPLARQRRADAAVVMSRRSLAHAGDAVALSDRYRVHVNVDVRQLSTGMAKYSADEIIERPWIHGTGPISRATARRLALTAGFTLIASDVDGELIGTSGKAPPFSRSQVRALRARDRRCQVPGCDCIRYAEAHHLVHRANGGMSILDNGVYVCASCHRLLHEGGFRLERIGPNGADLGCDAAKLGTDSMSLTRAQAKVARIRKYRLYDKRGREYCSPSAARKSLLLSPEGHNLT